MGLLKIAALLMSAFCVTLQIDLVQSQTNPSCIILFGARVECARDVSQEDCERLNCCYNDKSPEDIPNCYFQEGKAPKYAEWGSWSSCSKTCGRGELTRERFCQYSDGRPAPTQLCKSKNKEVKRCPTQPACKRDPGEISCKELYPNICEARAADCTSNVIRTNCPITCKVCSETDIEKAKEAEKEAGSNGGKPVVEESCNDELGEVICQRLTNLRSCETELYGFKLTKLCAKTCKTNCGASSVSSTPKPVTTQATTTEALTTAKIFTSEMPTTKPQLPDLKYPITACVDEYDTCSRIAELCQEEKRFDQFYLLCRRTCNFCQLPIPNKFRSLLPTTPRPATTATQTIQPPITGDSSCRDSARVEVCVQLDCSLFQVQQVCSKTCGACETTPPPATVAVTTKYSPVRLTPRTTVTTSQAAGCYNSVDDEICENWNCQLGDVKKFCAKTCGTCRDRPVPVTQPRTTNSPRRQPSGPVPANRNCPNQASDVDCERNSEYCDLKQISELCPRTCGTCPMSGPVAPTTVATTSTTTTTTQPPRTVASVCRDGREYCPQLYRLCTDPSYSDVMRPCDLTCNRCGRISPIIFTQPPTTTSTTTTTTTIVPEVCEDELQNCDTIVRFCENEQYSHITKFCKKTCGVCGSPKTEYTIIPYDVQLRLSSIGEIAVSWQMPVSNIQITKFLVILTKDSTRQTSEYFVSVDNRDYSYTVNQFTAGEIYTAEVVTIVNDVQLKTSKPSPPLITNPPIPFNVRLNPTSQSPSSTIEVMWMMPTSDFVISGFEIELSSSDGQVEIKNQQTNIPSRTYSFILRGLLPGEFYRATVRAQTSRGKSVPSAPSPRQSTVCEDTYNNCDALRGQCNEESYRTLLREQCALTCNTCPSLRGPQVTPLTIARRTTATQTTTATTTTTQPRTTTTTTTTQPITTEQPATTIPRRIPITNPSITTPKPKVCRDKSSLCRRFNGTRLCQATDARSRRLQLTCLASCNACDKEDELKAIVGTPRPPVPRTPAPTTRAVVVPTTPGKCEDRFPSTCKSIKERNVCGSFKALKDTCPLSCEVCKPENV